jgi:phosphomannomutase
MQKQKAVIGGEGNGGVIYPRINFARDSLVGMALILHLIAREGKTVTELLSQFPHYTILKEKLLCPSYKLPAVLKALRQDYANYPMDLRDGIKVTLPEGWFLVRGSNTEPIIRVTAEAKSEREVRKIVTRVFARVKTCIDENGTS